MRANEKGLRSRRRRSQQQSAHLDFDETQEKSLTNAEVVRQLGDQEEDRRDCWGKEAMLPNLCRPQLLRELAGLGE